MANKKSTKVRINSDAADKFWRRSRMVEIIPDDGTSVTVSELCKRLASFKNTNSPNERNFEQTVRRDVNALVKLYGKDTLLIRSEKAEKKPKTHLRIRWAKGKRPVDRFTLTQAQIIAFGTLEKIRSTLLPAQFKEALYPFSQMARQKARSELGSNTSGDSDGGSSSYAEKWLAKIESIPERIEFLEPVVDENILITVHRALMEEQSLRIRYNKKEERRLIHPLGLVQQGARTYLIATFENRPNAIALLLARIDEAKFDIQPLRTPENFDLKTFLRRGIATPNTGEFSVDDFGQDINIRLKINTGTSWIKETPISKSQRTYPCVALEPKGDFYLEATLPLTENLIWWLLSMSHHIQVIEPQKLQLRVKGDLEAALAKYQDLEN
jgi:predicted DNA-binding transcriptional regulator YafY